MTQTSPSFWVVVLRWFEIMQGSLLICVIVGVVVFYTLSEVPNKRLLRFHVIFVSLSYLGAIAFMMVELLERMNQPLTWRGIAATWIFSAGLAAMILLVIHLIAVPNSRTNAVNPAK